jgi:hypothetical protein
MANVEPRTKGCNNDVPNRFRFGALQKPREARDEWVRATSLPRILTVAEGTNPITVGQCGFRALPNPRTGGPGLVQRQAKQTRSYLQVWYLIYHKVEVSHLPNHITRLLLPPTF